MSEVEIKNEMAPDHPEGQIKQASIKTGIGAFPLENIYEEKTEIYLKDLEKLAKNINELIELLGGEGKYLVKVIKATKYISQFTTNVEEVAKRKAPKGYKFVKYLWISWSMPEVGLALYIKR